MNISKLNLQQACTKEIFTLSLKLFINEPEHQPGRETQESHRIYVAIRAIDRNSLTPPVSNIVQALLFIPSNSTPVLARDCLILKVVLTAMGLVEIVASL